ncbi:MAG: anaerobic ribonucleoside-triphosphate reductase activating protein, partial [Alphaproteobacteria bacterium]
MLPPVKGLLETTMIDWEGRLATEVFLPGCNFRCPFCHARSLVLEGEVSESIPLAAVDACLERNAGWVDGVIISGGEACLQPGLPDLIRHFRAHGMAVKLDTNGSRPDVLDELLGKAMLTAVSMDVKAPLDERYHAVAGVHVDLDAIRASIEMLIAADVDHEFRTTLCPALHDADAVEQTALAVRGARRYVLQRFRPLNCLNPDFNRIEPFTDEAMRDFADIARRFVSSCQVRGDQ